VERLALAHCRKQRQGKWHHSSWPSPGDRCDLTECRPVAAVSLGRTRFAVATFPRNECDKPDRFLAFPHSCSAVPPGDTRTTCCTVLSSGPLGNALGCWASVPPWCPVAHETRCGEAWGWPGSAATGWRRAFCSDRSPPASTCQDDPRAASQPQSRPGPQWGHPNEDLAPKQASTRPSKTGQTPCLFDGIYELDPELQARI